MLMIEEQHALIEQLERLPDIPLHHRRGMLDVLSQQIGYMDQATYRRYQSVATTICSELIASICPCAGATGTLGVRDPQ